MQLRILLFCLTVGILCFCTSAVQAGTYLSSAHGSTTYGVERPSMAGFAVANCAHCHEQHASVGGSEPAPVTPGPTEYLLFDQSNSDQATNFCFNCHGTGTAYQTGGHVKNRSYSYRAGDWSTDTLDNIKDAFALSQASSHNLTDIVDFADGPVVTWKYTANSNACAVCHDPHVVQGDPADSGNFPKAPGGGVVITEINTTPGNLWGDGLIGVKELMSQYAPPSTYQAPYRAGPASYEPDGSATTDGSNLPNYVAFCTTCHNATNTIFSSDLGRNLKFIDWSAATGNKHGQFSADDDIQMQLPYTSGSAGLGYVLSCLDCHEPHGSGSQSLLREKVNGGLTGAITGGQFGQLCRQCHNPNTGAVADWQWEHHGDGTTDAPYNQGGTCIDCHIVGTNRINCVTCHYHGAVAGSGGIPLANNGVPPLTAVPKTF